MTIEMMLIDHCHVKVITTKCQSYHYYTLTNATVTINGYHYLFGNTKLGDFSTGFSASRACCDIGYPSALRWRHNGHDCVLNHQPHHCLLNRLFGCRSKKTSKLRVTGLCVGNSPGTGEFPAQMACNAENVSIWWRHHGNSSLNLNFVKSRSCITFLHVAQYILIFVWSTTVMLSCSVQNFKTIRLFNRMLWTNEISRDLSLRRVSVEYFILRQTPGFWLL